MSSRDQEIIELSGLRNADIATALGVTRQAVFQGVNKTNDYLGKDRLKDIYSWLAEHRPEAAVRFRHSLDQVLDPDELHNLNLRRIEAAPDYPEKTIFDELWVLSYKPREFSAAYATSMGVHLRDPDKIIHYYVPPGVGQDLAARLEKSLGGSKPDARVEIYECEAMVLFPHLIIIDPNDELKCQGAVRDSAGEMFPYIWKDHVLYVVSTVNHLRNRSKTAQGESLLVFNRVYSSVQ